MFSFSLLPSVVSLSVEVSWNTCDLKARCEVKLQLLRDHGWKCLEGIPKFPRGFVALECISLNIESALHNLLVK